MDLDRLHDVALGYRWGRGSGKTYLLLQMLVGHVRLGVDKNIAVVSETYQLAERYCAMARDVFRKEGMEIERSTKLNILVEGVMVRFVVARDLEWGTMGWGDHGLIEMDK